MAIWGPPPKTDLKQGCPNCNLRGKTIIEWWIMGQKQPPIVSRCNVVLEYVSPRGKSEKKNPVDSLSKLDINCCLSLCL